jgi:hypothetical protein
MKRYFTILILCCLLTASACGVMGDRRSAKHLVTRADAEKIMGAPMIFDGEKLDVGQTNCYYRDADGGSSLRLQVTVQEYESDEQTKDAHEMMREMNRHYVKVQPVEGVGDAAWIEDREFSQAIHVRRKNVHFLIAADGGGRSEKRLGEIRRVARSVAERL